MKRRIFSLIICIFTMSFSVLFLPSANTFAETQTSTTMTRQECIRRKGSYDRSTKTCTYETNDNDTDSSTIFRDNTDSNTTNTNNNTDSSTIFRDDTDSNTTNSNSTNTSNSSGSVQGYSGHNDNDCFLLGFVSWDCKIGPMNSESAIRAGIWQIAANIATDISVAAAYLVLGFTIYGGYLYMLSGGDPGKVAAGKKTLTNAFIGLAITMLATTIMSTIRVVLAVNNGNLSCDLISGDNCVSGANIGQMVTNIIQWFLGFASVVALVFVFIGGASYMTSAGDPGKVQKAKKCILYALIGLAIVALAEVITGFVANLIRNANNETNASTHLISPPPSSNASDFSISYNNANFIKEPHDNKID